MPQIRSVREEDFAPCVAYIAEREGRCVTLMSNLVQDGKPRFPDRNVRAFVRLSDAPASPIDGVLAITPKGILLHCLREGADLSPYAPLISRFLSAYRIRCVMGGYEDTLFLESLISGNPVRSTDYQLMTFEPDREAADTPHTPEAVKAAAVPPEGISVVRCTPDDTDRLAALQEGYEKEEVIPPGDPFDRDAMKINLRVNLGKQYIFMAVSGGVTVAKAGTNALGYRWVQIGGVYTLPEWRGRGVARTLVRHIAESQSENGHKVALFVKLTNTAARKAYDRAGFTNDSLFRISYW